MAKFEKRINYRDRYLDLNNAIIEVLEQSDRNGIPAIRPEGGTLPVRLNQANCYISSKPGGFL